MALLPPPIPLFHHIMPLKLSQLLLFVALFTPISSVNANPQHQHQQQLFRRVDSNNDGKLTRKEFVQAVIKRLFSEFDLNHDKRVTRDEFFKHARDKKLAQQEYPIMDTEGKGYILLKEVTRNQPLILRLREDFKKLDTANKGYITLKDLPKLNTPR